MRIESSLFLLLLFLTCSCNAQDAALPFADMGGTWAVRLNSNDIGEVNTMLEFEADEASFVAYSRKGADRAILGYGKSTLARTFTKNFKNGSLIRITDGKITRKGDTLVLFGIFRSASGSYYFNGNSIDGHFNATLKNGKQELKGSVSGMKNAEIEFPLNDYPAIVAEALDTAKSRIFNRKEIETKQWQAFEKAITDKSKVFQDDVELVFAFYYFASQLPFSHFALTRLGSDSLETKEPASKQFLYLEEKNSTTAWLRITSFGGSASEVDSVMNEIIEKKYENLIVDLRNNPGGSVEAGMAFARRVVDTPLYGGIFLTQKWFNVNERIPNETELEEFPTFSEANYDLIIEGIHKEKGLVLKVIPSETNFKGELYIVTNSRTASTSEPIVQGLKASNRATVVGQTTAGAMLNGERFGLKSGFSVYVPTADYYTMDGSRIDQIGVEPNIVLKKADPLEYIVNELIK